MVNNKKNQTAASFIALACLLWATDSFVRYPTSLELNYKVIVLLEHLLGLILIAPWLFLQHRKELIRVSWRHLPLFIIVGVGGSALGTIFFTRSLQYIGPSSSLLFQMMQPTVVVLLAYLFLKERHSGIFLQCAFWVILNALFIGIPNFNFGFVVQSGEFLWAGIMYAVLAMLMWGAATVAGKALLRELSPGVVVFYRWLAAITFVAFLVYFDGTPVSWKQIASWEILGPLAYLGMIPGVVAMVIYYHGLREIPASVATFIELIYALLGVVLPAVSNHQKFNALQIVGAVTLLMAISALAGLDDKVVSGS